MAPGGRKQAEASPYLEAMRARGYEVLFLYAHVDEFVMQHVLRAQGEGPGLLTGGDARGYRPTRRIPTRRIPTREKKFDHALPRADGVSVRLVRARGARRPSHARLHEQRLTAAPALLVGHESKHARHRAMLTMMSDEATAASWTSSRTPPRWSSTRSTPS